MNDKSQLLYVSPSNLRLHPKNLRRFYPARDVRAIADSMRTRIRRKKNPVIHPLVIVPNGKAGYYFVADGNMRLKAALTLGATCPPLACILSRENKSDQVLTMLTTERFRYALDPISRALGFKQLTDEHGYTPARISKEIGCSVTSVYYSLMLLNLDPAIQDLIALGQLPSDQRVARALLAVPDTNARVKLAKRLASNSASIKTILTACQKLTTSLNEAKSVAVKEAERGGSIFPVSPALELAENRSHLHPQADTAMEWSAVRQAMQATCQTCEIRESSLLQDVAEPGWVLIAHAAQATCAHCNVADVVGACKQCPTVEIIQRLLEQSDEYCQSKDLSGSEKQSFANELSKARISLSDKKPFDTWDRLYNMSEWF